MVSIVYQTTSLAILAFIPFSFFIYNPSDLKFTNEDGSVFIAGMIYALSFLLVFLYLLYKTVTRFTLITISDENQTITFHLPLRFKKKTYSLTEITGIRFASSHTKICDFKCLIFKAADSSTFMISDFVLSNLYDIQNYSVEHFHLCEGKDFRILTGEEKEAALLKDTRFIVTQAKSYRESCYFLIGTIVIIVIICQFIGIPSRKPGLVSYCMALLLFAFAVVNISRANKTLRDFG